MDIARGGESNDEQTQECQIPVQIRHPEREFSVTMPHEAETEAATAGQIGAELAEYARALGAELYGVASAADYVREFPDKPSPERFVEGAQSVIIIGLPFEPGTVATVLHPELAGLRAKNLSEKVGCRP
ncbi:MAG TPA: hypothetical protein VM537_08025 [Anaerolineae bacterium]|nr:hypothetical protein [Anaerolineae bacterium]